MESFEILADLLNQWRKDAAFFRRFGAESNAITIEKMTNDLEATLSKVASERVSLRDAERISGYSRSHLKRMMSEGRLRYNLVQGKPYFVRTELPKKPGKTLALCGADTASSRTQVGRAIAEGG